MRVRVKGKRYNRRKVELRLEMTSIWSNFFGFSSVSLLFLPVLIECVGMITLCVKAFRIRSRLKALGLGTPGLG